MYVLVMGLASIVSLLDAWCSSFLFPKTFKKSFIYLFLLWNMLGLRCSVGFSLVAASRGCV